MELDFKDQSSDTFENTIEPLKEMAAYEALWSNRNTSYKKLAEFFSDNIGKRPSDLVDEKELRDMIASLAVIFTAVDGLNYPKVLIKNTHDYPPRLLDASDPIEVLYYFGNIGYLDTKSVAIVGSRKPSPEGLKRASKLVKLLVKDDYTIASGLAQGIDSMAHHTCLQMGGRTIGVIGTPLNEFYPKENKDTQQLIADEHLLISQVPFIRYTQQTYRGNKLFFPERNKTMSALSEATVIVEASDTSGTLIQARAALKQSRKLFILDSCFLNKNITWPHKFLELGAKRIKEFEEIQEELKK